MAILWFFILWLLVGCAISVLFGRAKELGTVERRERLGFAGRASKAAPESRRNLKIHQHPRAAVLRP